MNLPVTEFIENDVLLHDERSYGAILGLSPSKGARSPVLWRAAFSALRIEADFHPFDVTEEALGDLVHALRQDKRFVGGAIAVPHKELIIDYLDEVDPVAKHIGAVNALYRTPDGGIGGTNTDGAAARDCLADKAGDLLGKRIALLGLGGAGIAVASYLAEAGAVMSVWNRNAEKANRFADKAAKSSWAVSVMVNIDSIPDSIDVLVNCTSVGFSADGEDNNESLVSSESLQRLPPSAVVYDIIYQPLKTALLRKADKQGLQTLNGLCMNQKQAVLAFCRAFPKADSGVVKEAMNNA